MVKVYFETTKDGIHADGRYSELVAILDSEETYDACINALEAYAKEANYVVTESLVENTDMNTNDLGRLIDEL